MTRLTWKSVLRTRDSVLRTFILAGVMLCGASFTRAESSWAVPSATQTKADVDAWLATQKLSEAQKQEIELLWLDDNDSPSGAELLEQLTTTLAAANADAKAVVVHCRAPRNAGANLPEFKILADDSHPALVRNNLRLLYGSWLARNDMHEEALAQLEDLAASDVVDPASLLFYTSVCHHRLRDKDACLPAIAQLLENEAAVPRRFRELAQLMQADLEPLKPDTLDEVARLMDSIRRRLELGRVGKRVRDEEDQVIAKLDKMIDQLEEQRKKQQQQQQQQQNQQNQNRNPNDPLQESRPGDVKGPGNVDNKKLQDNGNWGNLPPKQRQEALQQISKELPAHYREAVEEYFRKLARESDK